MTLTPNQSTNVTFTPFPSHESGWDRPSDTDDCAPNSSEAVTEERTPYQYGESDTPDVETVEEHARTEDEYGQTNEPDPCTVSDTADTRASSPDRSHEEGLYGDLSADEDQSVSSHASSAASSAPLDHSAEEYIDWLCAGCPDTDLYD